MKIANDAESDINDYTVEIGRILQNVTRGTRKFKDVKRFPLIDGKQCLYIMNWRESKLTYTRGVEKMLGYSKEEFTMNKVLITIHPDDQKIVNRIIRGIINHSIKTNVTGADQYLTMTFRTQKKDGTYLKVMRQASPYQLDNAGKFVSNLSFLTDISFMRDNEKVEWELFSNEMDLEDFKQDIYSEFEDFFTKREMDTINCLKHDLTNKQIALQLFISAHTVVAHKKNILKKSNCHNTKELLSFCRTNGMI